jgi:hypothetical protein
MNESRMTNITINPDNLYKEESFSDLTYVTIRRLTPVNIDGSVDASRDTIFTGMAQLMSPNGPIPVHCIIDEAKEMDRQQASKLIVPGQ